MYQGAASNDHDLDNKLMRWVLDGREDALQSNRTTELPGWARALDFRMRTTGRELLLKVVTEFEMATGAKSSYLEDVRVATA